MCLRGGLRRDKSRGICSAAMMGRLLRGWASGEMIGDGTWVSLMVGGTSGGAVGIGTQGRELRGA